MYNEKDIEYRLQSGIISNMDFHDTQTLLYLKNKITASYKELTAAVQCPDFFIVTNKLAALHLIEIFPCKTSLKPDCYASDAITNERENRKMENKEFAEYLGISPQKLKHWENGKHDFCIYEISYIMHKLGLDYKITVERVGDSQPN